MWRNLYGERTDHDPYEYFSTVPKPGAIWDDRSAIEAAEKCTDEFLANNSVPRLNECGKLILDRCPFMFSGEVMGSLDAFDRTLETPLIIPDAITSSFIRHLQQTLLVKFPLWRVHVVGTHCDGEESIMVYPEVVCVGKLQCPPRDLEASLSIWRRQTNQIREKAKGPARRQFQYVKERLPRSIEQIQKHPPVALVAVFDNWRGEGGCFSAWILQDDDYLTCYPISPDDLSHTAQFMSVTSGGEVVFDEVDGIPYRKLEQWNFHGEALAIPFTVVMEHSESKQQWKLEVRPEDFRTDDQLRTYFGEAHAS